MNRRRNMKSNILSLLTLGLLFSAYAFAHNPADITIDPDFKSNRLSIAVAHHVGSRHNHYIKTIEVTVDGQEPLMEEFRFQTGPYQRTTIRIPGLDEAKSVTIKAECSKGGSLVKTFDLEKERQSDE